MGHAHGARVAGKVDVIHHIGHGTVVIVDRNGTGTTEIHRLIVPVTLETGAVDIRHGALWVHRRRGIIRGVERTSTGRALVVGLQHDAVVLSLFIPLLRNLRDVQRIVERAGPGRERREVHCAIGRIVGRLVAPEEGRVRPVGVRSICGDERLRSGTRVIVPLCEVQLGPHDHAAVREVGKRVLDIGPGGAERILADIERTCPRVVGGRGRVDIGVIDVEVPDIQQDRRVDDDRERPGGVVDPSGVCFYNKVIKAGSLVIRVCFLDRHEDIFGILTVCVLHKGGCKHKERVFFVAILDEGNRAISVFDDLEASGIERECKPVVFLLFLQDDCFFDLTGSDFVFKVRSGQGIFICNGTVFVVDCHR